MSVRENAAADRLRTDILLIRHARSAPNPDIPEAEWPLSMLGHKQAVELANQIAGQGITTIASSPYLRAVDTVRPLAERLGLTIRVVEDLRERKLREGVRDDWEALVARSWADFSFALPNCESGFVARNRICRALERLAREHPGQTIAVCSHGNAIGLFLNSLDQSFGYVQWQTMKNPDIFHLTWDGALWRRNDTPRASGP